MKGERLKEFEGHHARDYTLRSRVRYANKRENFKWKLSNMVLMGQLAFALFVLRFRKQVHK